MIQLALPWRTAGRIIYAQLGPEPGDDLPIGMMDSPEIAAEAVAGHNALQEARLL